MKIKQITHGRTIVVGDKSFRQEKVWFGWDAEIDTDTENEEQALAILRERADVVEAEERRNFNRKGR